jgi:hypothetical protein
MPVCRGERFGLRSRGSSSSPGPVSSASAAPSTFDLVFTGKHNPQLLHEGPFTSSSPRCPSGYAADVSVDDQTATATRVFTCDGSGDTFTARVSPLPAEHGGSGGWRIVAGTGSLQDLRGQGTWTSVRTGGDPADPASITFRSTWSGIADLDATPPTIVLTTSTIRKLRGPSGTYALTLAVALGDAGGGQISYRLTVVDPGKPLEPLAVKSGQAAAATFRYQLRVRPAKTARALRIKIDATDQVDNKATFSANIRLK